MTQIPTPFADLAGKRALVTGASGGLGLEFARILAGHGVAVTLAARRRQSLEAIAARFRGEGRTAQALGLDVADTAAVRDFFASAPAFDIVVNNAGITSTVDAVTMPTEDWERIIATNLTGAFVVAQAAAAAMIREDKGGAIVNIASILGKRVSGKLAAYATSKAALIQMSRSLALEWARHGIRVNALCPGYIETDINREFFASEAGKRLVARIPQRRLGSAADLAAPLLLLCSQAGAFMTGTEVVVDGGHLVSGL